ncbi:Indoleamine 2,3-dioxygenase [Rhodocollybia butyracea]|uniref:Indoleamine 2,3-dioxygenase n=1 Tax=Rhodocollybia butyracea TaxID=206335 RepID=A0A9P5P5W2_9AGAR|nr:Indoleamine 2,3-dioxygenase [Rhodocollybia butyracea]
MEYLDPSHFLSLPRPSAGDFHVPVVDTTTLAAHDFDVDPRTGFMPPQPPVERLFALEGENYERWEDLLAQACAADLQIADKLGGLSLDEERRSEQWRAQVRLLPILPITPLLKSEVLLRRAHCVLASIMHFYIHSLPTSALEIRIPPPITLPLLQISRELQLPPVVTYSDDVLYNWGFLDPTTSSSSPFGTIDPQNLRVLTTFTSTPSESHFYLTSARIELIGVRALALMQSTLDELFVGDAIAVRRITKFLNQLGTSGSANSRGIIGEMEIELNNMSVGCDPQVFYEQIRPWFRGIDVNNLKEGERRWIFEGIEMDERLEEPTELSGPSAGQSSIIHALDVFLGVEQFSHARTLTGRGSDTASSEAEDARPDDTSSQPSSFLSRMQLYMPDTTHHPLPLLHPSLSSLSPFSAIATDDALALLSAYNAAVLALKKFRDAHIVIVARYIIAPASRARRAQEDHESRMEAGEVQQTRTAAEAKARVEKEAEPEAPLKGSGGTELAQFLKAVRDGTKDAVIGSSL